MILEGLPIIFSTHVEMNRLMMLLHKDFADFLYARGDEPVIPAPILTLC